MDQFDKEAIQEYLLEQLTLVQNYRKHCAREVKQKPSGSARLNKFKAELMRDYVLLLLEKLQS